MAMPVMNFGLRLQATHCFGVSVKVGVEGTWRKQQMALKEVDIVMCHWNSSPGPCVLSVWEAELADKCFLQFE